MSELQTSLIELIRRTSAEIPDDVHQAILTSLENEKKESLAANAMKIIDQNIALAKNKSQPICQDTGSILFFVACPVGYDQITFAETAREAVTLATKKGFLRQNSVDSLTGKNDGTNVGPGAPAFHFHQHRSPEVCVKLVLKGGGCENVGAQYSLPSEKLNANRDLDGCRKAILDAVLQAQGKGCGPGILGVCIGGDRATGYEMSKTQFLRLIPDRNPVPELDALEQDILKTANELGIGPMGFGGKTTLLGVKICAANRLPASYFVSISYMCWAYRRQGVTLDAEGKIGKWLYKMTVQAEEKVAGQPRRRSKSWLLIMLGGGFLLVIAFAYYHWRFPYGKHHRCILILSGALRAFADDHSGVFPSGGNSPEASLSLLRSGSYADAELLAGKTASASAARKILSNGGSLGPNSCSWHYVEGLTTTDDARVAILWDKVGLGHDGQRLRQGGHEVIFVDGGREFIAGKDWPLFMEAQNELLSKKAAVAKKGKPVVTGEMSFLNSANRSYHASPFTLWSKPLGNYDKSYYVYSTMTSLTTNAGYTIARTGSVLMPAALTWYQDEVPQTGVVEYILTLSNFRSWPVVVEFKDGKPDAEHILFQMSEK